MLAGADEFLADAFGGYSTAGALPPTAERSVDDRAFMRIMPEADDAKKAYAAHNLLKIDAGYLTTTAATWFRGATANIPKGYTVVDKKPESSICSIGGYRVGVVFFPRGAGAGFVPTQEQKKRILAEGASLASKVDFVIGVSPWGSDAEQAFLPEAQGVFACIFGGGDGIPFSHSVQPSAPGVLWVRSENRGRGVTVVNLLEIPRKGVPFIWKEGRTFTASIEYLSNKYRDDRAVEAIIGKPPVE